MILLAGLLAAAAGAALVYLAKIAPVGSGYKAKVLSSAVFVCERDPKDVLAADLKAEDYAILRLFSVRVDSRDRSVSSSLLGTGIGEKTVFAASTDKPAASAFENISPKNPASLERALDDAFRETDPEKPRRTRAVVVLKDGRLAAERYAPGYGPEKRMPGWSKTKSLSAALAGILVGQKKLALEKTNLLPEWENDERRRISLEDLLRMRSGLAFAEVYSDPMADAPQMLFNSKDCAAYAAAKPLAHPPGSFWSYSSGTTNILCRLMKDACGGSYEKFLAFAEEFLFKPVGMSSAVFEADAAGTPVGSSFGFMTARDWARFGQLHLQDGVWNGKRVLPEGWTKFSCSQTPQSEEGCYGAHWWRKLPKVFGGKSADEAKIPEDAYYALGHEGQTTAIIPSRGVVIVRHGLTIKIDGWNQAAFTAAVLDAV